MLRPYSQLKQEVYLAPKQSVRSDLSSMKTFSVAGIIFCVACLTLTFIIKSAALYLGLGPKSLIGSSVAHSCIFSVMLSTATGLIVFIQSSVLRKVTFKFPMIKAFQPKTI